MSLLTPVKVPVKVYKWDDAGAPQLDKSPNCVTTIFKACLVTGYGTKQNAGWTMPFEDAATGTKVFRPELGTNTDFYLRLSDDSGTEVRADTRTNMTSADDGDFMMWCGHPFKYAKRNASGKWLLVATPRGFIFCCEQNYNGDARKTGAFFVVGAAPNTTDKGDGIYLHHTGGSDNDGDYASINGIKNRAFTQSNLFYSTQPQLLSGGTVIGITNQNRGLFDGANRDTDDLHTIQMMVIANQSIYSVPGLFFPSTGAANNNFDVLNINQSLSGTAQKAVTFGTAGNGASNIYICTDYWVY